MTPEQFIAAWKNNPLNERAGAQQHFSDLCDLLGVDKPRDQDNYCFERGAKKAGGGDGWADVWKRGHFAWENKKPGRDLNAALKQLTDYALHLDNPPLLVVCDRERIVIHTAFTGYPDEPREIRIEQLSEPEARQTLKWAFTDPEKLRPEKSTATITAEAAGQFAQLAAAMRNRGEEGQKVAHFLVQCLFCMFAEDETLLPAGIFTDLLRNAGSDTGKAARRIEKLFTAMQKKGGDYGDHDIPWFNGGLFKNIEIPSLTATDLHALHRAAADMDWRAIDPTIFGTLFERGLDPAARAPLGAHYTDTGTIAKLIQPLVCEPLAIEWQNTRRQIAELAPKFGMVKGRKKNEYRPNDALQSGNTLLQGFFNRINAFRVLDPACGSGNFLYLALKALRDIEKRAHIDAQELGLQPELAMHSGPHNILGLEINEFAAELARVTVWIGDIQWCRRNGYPHAINPILKPLDGIDHRDALLNPDGSEAEWPTADVIVGNPPFLGDKVMRSELGDDYVETLRKTYDCRVPGGADLVTYWFEKARGQIEAGKLQGAGLVATNSIRGGANRKVLERIVDTTRIFEAWSDEEWVNDGAAVRVSLIGFGPIFPVDRKNQLEGLEVGPIHADLTATAGINLIHAKKLAENSKTSFIGPQKNGPFDVPFEIAMRWLNLPNPNGLSNAKVVTPTWNGLDITRRPRNVWVIDFGTMSEGEASLFEAPFDYVTKHVKPERIKNRRQSRAENWWLFGEPAPKLNAALKTVPRYVATSAVSKHRIFVWLPSAVSPDKALVVVARGDDATFGILHSRFHELWSLSLCTWLGVGNDPRYTPTTCFETFPFPAGLTPRDTAPKPGQASPPCMANEIVAANIAAAARRLNELREAWLNPAEWVDWVITPEEEKAGFPKRPVAKPGHEAELKKRTLTNLYNARPAWLDIAHKELDKAVAAAYGWNDYKAEMPDDEILRRLLALNLERSTTKG
ncbi:SAM-dependent methyltransferase [Azonexus hydrophilus]|uniref:site-specific DNA-methyltransferase (adenine-specific) n=1 Tax=Azonexus hydrophilus TaxID=418702 RepID=A0A1R1I4C5_9RHOO|nr:DNA methyltransferase [Azonexus hydrophilus]OMG53563.1 SAM-dependent methyltransferase [Azonexus hydrophilus]